MYQNFKYQAEKYVLYCVGRGNYWKFWNSDMMPQKELGKKIYQIKERRKAVGER